MHRDRDEQRLRGVEATRDADHDLLDPGGAEPGARGRLRWIEYTSAHRSARSAGSPGTNGKRGTSPPQRRRAATGGSSVAVTRRYVSAVAVVVDAVDEARHPHPVGDQPVEVDVGAHQRGSRPKRSDSASTLPFSATMRVAVPREVGGRLVHDPAPAYTYARDRAGRLRGAQLAPVARLADRDVAARQVGHHGGARHASRSVLGGIGHPDVLADLDRDHEVGHVDDVEQQVGAERAPRAPNSST